MSLIVLLILWIAGMVQLNSSHIWKVLIHKIAMIKTAYRLKIYFYIPMYLHDTDKIFYMLFFTKHIASLIHKKTAFHHFSNIWKQFFYLEMILDWECSRLTKKNKKQTAIEWFNFIKNRPKFEIKKKDFFNTGKYNVSDNDVAKIEELLNKYIRRLSNDI